MHYRRTMVNRSVHRRAGEMMKHNLLCNTRCNTRNTLSPDTQSMFHHTCRYPAVNGSVDRLDFSYFEVHLMYRCVVY